MMFTKNLLLFSGLLAFAGSASAHFQMQFPVPRGVFVMTNEVNFCDGYNDAVSNRSEFPLGQGFISLNSEHPSWSADVLISIEQNPTNFSVFNQSLTGVELPFAVPIFKASGEGLACIAIDIGNLGIPGVGDGSNVTIQVQFNGGDGNLFQCADLTLSSSFTIPSDVNCTHLVSNTTVSNSSSTATSTSSTSTSSNGALSLLAGNSGFFGLIVAGILSFL